MSTLKDEMKRDESQDSWRTGLYEFLLRVRWVNILVVGLALSSPILIFLEALPSAIYVLTLANTLALISLLNQRDDNGR